MAEERHTLTVEDSLALWLEGRVAFNAWTAKHRSADLNFSGVDFSQYRRHPKVSGPEWPFALRDCGNCSLTFDGANFGDGDTSFRGLMASADGADISFRNAMFGEGNVNFSGGQFLLCDFTEAKFGDGDLNFSHRNFGQETVFDRTVIGVGRVLFRKTRFITRVSFDHTKFGDGDVDFRFAKFGETGLENIFDSNPYVASFAGAVFGQGRILFSNAKIFRGDLTFFKTAFGDSDVSFEDSTFECKEISFKDAHFGDGEVGFNRAAIKAELFDFRGVRCGKSNFNAQDAAFSGRSDFSNLRDVSKVGALNFRFCKFDGAFSLAASERFNCVPDFVGTKTSHHFSLEGVECEFAPTKPCWFLWKRLKTHFVDERSRRFLDAERFRRLKELATDNRDFKKALDFNAEEIRASRWRGTRWVWKLLPEFVFWFGSDYGRSIWRAGSGLIGLWLLCALLYLGSIVGWWWRDGGATVVDALALSFSQMYGYLTGNRVFRQEMLTSLFGDNSSTGLFWLANAQSVLTIIGTFLLGLSLRNRFNM